MNAMELPKAAQAAIALVVKVDLFITETEPFRMAKDEKTGRKYWYSHARKKSSWVIPSEVFVKSAAAALEAAAGSTSKEEGGG